MTATSNSELIYDPYDREVARDPHALFKRMRDEVPLYYNEERDFYALSRYDDVEHALVNKETFISGRGGTLGILKSGMQLPPGTVLFEDPPTHTVHRKLLSRMFTPRRIAELEPSTRQICVDLLDPLAGSGGFDFIADFGKYVPTWVISRLIGIPTQEGDTFRDNVEARRGQADRQLTDTLSGEVFSDYLDWRVDHPSDDIMTQLLNAEFEDEHGEMCRLTREELLAYVNIVALAGNETTRLLIGWMAKLLSDHPDQRRLLVEDPSMMTNAVDESLRLEGPTMQVCRYVARDAELHDQVVPAGSIMALLVLSANHDERHLDDPDRFDVTRANVHHFTLGFGAHYCLGQALARLEARVVMEEVLKRFPDWEVDDDRAKMRDGDVELRGWDLLPIVIS